MTPDPSGMAAVDFTNPQSLNMYAYVSNFPTGSVDPLGLRLMPHNCQKDADDDCPNANDYLNTLASDPAGNFGSTWDEFGILQAAFTPTAIVQVADPEFIATGEAIMFPVYGRWDLVSYFGQVIWSPWYRVLGTVEGQGHRGQTHLNNRTSYGLNPQTDKFVALPDNTLQGQCVDVSAPNGYASAVPVGDVGPLNGGGPTLANIEGYNDPYWSPGGSAGGGFHPPETTTGVDLRGRTHFAKGAGIDISYALQQQLGMKGNANVSWRFAACN